MYGSRNYKSINGIANRDVSTSRGFTATAASDLTSRREEFGARLGPEPEFEASDS
jgi:hypothetical protein